jgi:amidase
MTRRKQGQSKRKEGIGTGPGRSDAGRERLERRGKLKRREFLRESALGSALVLVGSGVAGGAGSVLAGQQEGGGSAPAPALPRRSMAGFQLEEVTVAALQTGMADGKLSARMIAEMYLKRIEEVDKVPDPADRVAGRPGRGVPGALGAAGVGGEGGPGLNSVIEVNPDALAEAERADRERHEGRVRSPLHGIPILIKDNIDTADRMETTAGSLALVGQRPSRDAFIVERLRGAGAVVLGKTNLSEWANFRSMRSSSGWSGRGGQTHNPYALDRNPCGSSSGSGAAVAANLCAAAVGTETDGSIVCPASANSVVGLKPTVGLVSRSGIVPISHTQDTAGPMCRSVADAAALLGVLAGRDRRDAATDGAPSTAHADYSRFLDPKGLAGARIGIARNLFLSHERVVALAEDGIQAMKAEGAVIVDPTDMPHKDDLDKPEFEVLLFEFKADLNAYLAARGATGPARSLEDLIRFNDENRDREMPYFGQEIFEMAQAKGPLTSPEYLEALATSARLSRAEGIDALLAQHRLDAIVAPTGGPPWPTDLINGDHFGGGCSTHAAVAGYPHITVPLGYVYGLPVGLSFFGGAYSEPVLIRIAYAFERATRARKPPAFLPAADLTVG